MAVPTVRSAKNAVVKVDCIVRSHQYLENLSLVPPSCRVIAFSFFIVVRAAMMLPRPELWVPF